MAIWLIRAGKHGQYEQKFLEDKRIYVTWNELNADLGKMASRDDLSKKIRETYGDDTKPKKISNWVGQIWPFAHEMKIGDLVMLPLKTQRAIQTGEIIGEYQYEPGGPNPYYHWRAVRWHPEPIPRVSFGSDLLNSLGAAMTICRVQKNNAEERLLAMKRNGWKAEGRIADPTLSSSDISADSDEAWNIEDLAKDQIVKLIGQHFKKHELTRLVDALLRAEGYVTYVSPEGPDGGADILAGRGPLGFGSPRLCVEVKSGEGPIDRPTVDKLLGAIGKFNADEGLFVAWGGFKTNVQKELASQFFKVRLWGQEELLERIFESYDRLDEDIRIELPLKRIWAVASAEDEE